MDALRQKHRGLWRHEGGFTLAEVLVIILIMGILATIALTNFLGVAENRRVDSATNQLAADLRLAHDRATNQLEDHQIIVPGANSSTYQIGPSPGGPFETRTLPDSTDIAAATTITFKASGAAEVTSGAGSPITVKSATDATNNHTIEFNTQTSRIRVVKDVG